ncbi:MAG: TIGR04140 family protein [Thermococcus sp.]|nr:TIGR04140 family protein [Thermococcus sp.]MBO8174941.1 TIGR04140 family protein [Thermococcus sp.]
MKIITSIPPEELKTILKKSNAAVKLEIKEVEPFHGMPRYEVIIKGSKEEIEKFMEKLRLARAGG